MKHLHSDSLFPNESLQRIHDVEYLTYFRGGDCDKPLIVFFPGWGHLARIAYGGADISCKEFLADSFREKGYSFLAISYPIEHPIYRKIYPGLLLSDWAEAAATLAKDICQKYTLPYVIPIHWSAAGQLVTNFHKAGKAHQLSHPFSVSLEATPPILISLDRFPVTEIQTNGLVSAKELYLSWGKQLSTMLQHEVDQKIYEETFLGSFPVCLLGNPLVFSNGSVKENLSLVIKDHCCFDYRESPLVVSIAGNSKEAPYHPLVDRATWSFINERKIYHDYLTSTLSELTEWPNGQWDELVNSIQTFSRRMIYSIEGNHFLFVGQKRNQQIVQIIEDSQKVIAAFSENLKTSLKIQKNL